MARFDNAIALAIKLITKNGAPVTLRSVTAGVLADPAKPWEPTVNTNVDQTVNGVFLEYEQKYIDGAMIRMGDQIMLMASTNSAGGVLAPEPEVEGLIIRGTSQWKIVTSKPLNPNGQLIMFELQVRQ